MPPRQSGTQRSWQSPARPQSAGRSAAIPIRCGAQTLRGVAQHTHAHAHMHTHMHTHTGEQTAPAQQDGESSRRRQASYRHSGVAWWVGDVACTAARGGRGRRGEGGDPNSRRLLRHRIPGPLSLFPRHALASRPTNHAEVAACSLSLFPPLSHNLFRSLNHALSPSFPLSRPSLSLTPFPLSRCQGERDNKRASSEILFSHPEEGRAPPIFLFCGIFPAFIFTPAWSR